MRSHVPYKPVFSQPAAPPALPCRCVCIMAPVVQPSSPVPRVPPYATVQLCMCIVPCVCTPCHHAACRACSDYEHVLPCHQSPSPASPPHHMPCEDIAHVPARVCCRQLAAMRAVLGKTGHALCHTVCRSHSPLTHVWCHCNVAWSACVCVCCYRGTACAAASCSPVPHTPCWCTVAICIIMARAACQPALLHLTQVP